MQTFDLQAYLTQGVQKTLSGILKASHKYPHASLFALQYIKEEKKSELLRSSYESKGIHIPPFLIASISSKCNLHCAGCYARAADFCADSTSARPSLSASVWADLFSQAASLGIAFIILAGGEPFLRRDVIEAAAKQKSILFPIFTNGTLIDEHCIKILSRSRNLLPVLSIEGDEHTTDERRGKGVYQILKNSALSLQNRGIVFGASVTVHKENISEVFSDSFINELKTLGFKAVIYIEYVPADSAASYLAVDDNSRAEMGSLLKALRASHDDMLFISFPGDEKSAGGCLAAGRGFFHINPYGSAEPCPFSPHSVDNILNSSLLDILQSPFFDSLRNSGVLSETHTGGCTLFGKDGFVKEHMCK